jgi:hypothetical protein
MALPATGAISLNNVNVELGLSGTTLISMNQASVRTLFGKASGAIRMNDGYGKSNRVSLSYTYSASAVSPSLNVTTISGYNAGKSDITITINGGVYLYATSTGTPGLTLSGGTAGDTLTLVNNGYIMGMGGKGAQGLGSPPFRRVGLDGGTALQLGFNTTINNTNGSAYIGGGGGSGAAGNAAGGGGAAGGGQGGGAYQRDNGGAGGGPGSSGATGETRIDSCEGTNYYGGGGGGGRIFPGSGGSGATQAGGGAGGGGGGNNGSGGGGGDGGAANAAGGVSAAGSSGGGGGWGATGGASSSYAGGSGGKAVNLNGYTVTWTSGDTTRVYGSVA